MDKQTVQAIQRAFKQAMDAFNTSLLESLANSNSAVAVKKSSAKKGPGRPPKVKPAMAAVASEPKRRGRPFKIKDAAKVAPVNATPKRRGRPKKS